MDYKEIANGVKKLFNGDGDEPNGMSALWDLCWDLWENQSECLATKFHKNYTYYNGDYAPNVPKLSGQNKTTCNIVKRIIDVKGSEALDIKYTTEVVPVLNSFVSVEKMKDIQAYADVLNDELKNILEMNNESETDEILMRDGQVSGMGLSQVTIETDKDPRGEVCIKRIDPKNYRWDKNAHNIADCTFQGYEIELNPLVLKKRYGKNTDGTYNDEVCKKIDSIAVAYSEVMKGNQKGVVNISQGEFASQSYVYDTSGIESSKVVQLVVMFIMDGSVYAPVEGESNESENVKKKGQAKYPYGRMIMFAKDENKKLIFEDKPAPESFVNLGNIDIFKPVNEGNFVGKSEIDDLIPIQDRINGAYARLRILMYNHVNTVLLPDILKGIVKEGDFVQNPMTFVPSTEMFGETKIPPILNNGAITEGLKLLELIKQLESEAYKTAHINDLLISGMQPTGVNSAEQLEQIKESPLTCIRSLQRNFRNYKIDQSEKILNLVQSNYNVQRLIKLSTVSDGMNYAEFGKSGDKRTVKLIDEAGKVAKEITIDNNWKFKVRVSAGLDVPRSRRENSKLIDDIIKIGAINLNDPDAMEMYLRAKDVPNYRAIVQLIKKKQKETSEKKISLKDIISNPQIMAAAADLLGALQKGHNVAVGQLLGMVGLDGAVDTLETTPVGEVTSKADVKDIVAVAKGKISANPVEDAQGREIAGTILEEENNKHKKVVN